MRQEHLLRRRRWPLAAGLAATALTGLIAIGLPPAGAAPAFNAVAAAEGMRVTFQATGGPVTNTPFDAGSPVAQAFLDSLGSANAFASHAYPGDAVVAGPGTLSGASGGSINLPGYPLIAQSDATTTPDSRVSGGGASLEAHSSSERSESSATAGAFDSSAARVSSARAQATVTRTGGGPRALATNDVNGFAAGPLVLAQVRSLAEVAVADDGVMARRSELTVTGASIAGSAVQVGPAGVTIGPSASPLPGVPSVEEQLRQAGITLSYLAPQETTGGIVSAGLVVTIQRVVPGPVTPVGVSYLFGRTSARLGNLSSESSLPAAAGPPDAAAGGSPPAVPPAGGTPSAPAVEHRSGTANRFPLPAEMSLPPALAHLAAPSGPEPEGNLRAGDEQASGQDPALLVGTAAASGRPAGLFDTEPFYLVVAAGGLLAALTVRIIGATGKVSEQCSV